LFNSSMIKSVLVGAALLLATGPALAQAYPSKPIKLILPYAPGGIIDYVGRVIAQQLGKALGTTVVPDNRPGAGGISGTEHAAKSAPDGYTLLLMDPAIVINSSLHPRIPYDWQKEFVTVSVISSSPLVLVVNPSLPVETFSDFLAYAKANPGKLNFASAGIGTTPHLAGELLKLRAGVDVSHVPYRGIGMSYTDLVAGTVQFAFSSIAGAITFTKDDRLRPIATTGPERSRAYPDQPTVIESGLPGFEVDLWLAVFAPAMTPPAIVDKLNTELRKLLENPETQAAFAKVGAEPRGTTREEGARFVSAEFDRWAKVIEDAKVKLE
jgi:tripartite-type tricarboxylate transporter receptor subunit TctC